MDHKPCYVNSGITAYYALIFSSFAVENIPFVIHPDLSVACEFSVAHDLAQIQVWPSPAQAYEPLRLIQPKIFLTSIYNLKTLCLNVC